MAVGGGVAGWNFCSNAARAAACAGLSCAQAEIKLAQKARMAIAPDSLEIFMTLFYANFASEATAFRPAGNCFRHTRGSG